MYMDLFIYYYLCLISMLMFIMMYKFMLIVLMMVELVVMNMVMLMYSGLLVWHLEFYVIYYLVFSVGESVLGLTLLVLIVRYSGNEYYYLFNLMKF